MKRQRIIRITWIAQALFCAIVLTSCGGSGDDDLPEPAPTPTPTPVDPSGEGTGIIYLEPSISGMVTRGTIDGHWLADGTENVAVKIGNEVRQYYVNGKRTMFSENPFMWITDFSRDAQQTVSAWYPYSAELSIERSVSADQETSGLDGNDFMYASTAIAYQGRGDWVYPITFYHQVSKLNIIVNIDIPGDERTVTGIAVKNLALSGTFNAPGSGNVGTWTLAEPAEPVDPETPVEPTSITPKAVTGGWGAIAIPQTVAANTEFVVITLSDETTKTYSMPQSFTFLPNKVHDLTFNIKEKAITLNAQIHDWVENDLTKQNTGSWSGSVNN